QKTAAVKPTTACANSTRTTGKRCRGVRLRIFTRIPSLSHPRFKMTAVKKSAASIEVGQLGFNRRVVISDGHYIQFVSTNVRQNALRSEGRRAGKEGD